MTGNPLELFRKFFGAVRVIFWLWGSFLAPDKFGYYFWKTQGNSAEFSKVLHCA